MVIFHSFLYVYQRVIVPNGPNDHDNHVKCTTQRYKKNDDISQLPTLQDITDIKFHCFTTIIFVIFKLHIIEFQSLSDVYIYIHDM
jgi:hypothetical protein